MSGRGKGKRLSSQALWGATALSVLPVACEPQIRKATVLSCGEFQEYYTESIIPAFWFGFGDATPDAYGGSKDAGTIQLGENGEPARPPGPFTKEIKEPICQLYDTALFYKTAGHNDWGSAWGSAVRNRDAPYDASAFEGVAFWAKSSLSANKTFTLVVETRQTAKPLDAELADGGVSSNPSDCTAASTNEGAAHYRAATDGTQQITSNVAAPGDCGNSFRALVTTSHRWEFYRIPFDEFWQEAFPNRDVAGLDESKILQFAVRAAKETSLELSIAGLSFYRQAAPGAPPAGSASPQ